MDLCGKSTTHNTLRNLKKGGKHDENPHDSWSKTIMIKFNIGIDTITEYFRRGGEGHTKRHWNGRRLFGGGIMKFVYKEKTNR